MINDIYTPAEALKRLERAPIGRRHIVMGQNYASTNGALALAMRPKSPAERSTPALAEHMAHAMAQGENEGGFHG